MSGLGLDLGIGLFGKSGAAPSPPPVVGQLDFSIADNAVMGIAVGAY